MPDWLKGLDPSSAGYVSVVAIVILALIAFRIARRIVQIGFFVLFFAVGFAVVYAASAYSAHAIQVPLAIPIIGGLSFAIAANFVRAKLLRVVGLIILVFLFGLGAKFWGQYAQGQRRGGNENEGAAMKGLSAAKEQFGDLFQFLPKKDGNAAPGWIPADALHRAGINSDLEKVDQEPAWHTWLTGLFEQNKTDLGLWTAGGTEEQAKKSLQLRPKQ